MGAVCLVLSLMVPGTATAVVIPKDLPTIEALIALHKCIKKDEDQALGRVATSFGEQSLVTKGANKFNEDVYKRQNQTIVEYYEAYFHPFTKFTEKEREGLRQKLLVASKMEEDYDKFSHSMEDIDAQISCLLYTSHAVPYCLQPVGIVYRQLPRKWLCLQSGL